MKKVLLAFLLIIVLLVSAGVGAMYLGHSITNGNTILANISIGGIDVGGMSRDEARNALEAAAWEERVCAPVKVTTLGDVSFEVDPVKAGMALSLDDAVEAAFSHGHDKDIFGNLVTAVKLVVNPVDVNELCKNADTDYIDRCIEEGMAKLDAYLGKEEYIVDYEAELLTMVKGWGQIEIDRNDLNSAIVAALDAGNSELRYTKISKEPSAPDFDALHKKLEAEPVDASYSDDGKFVVSDEVVGCDFNVSHAQKAWNDAAVGGKVNISLDVTWPEVTGEYLRGQLYRDLLGACTTKFPNSAAPRRSNLDLATSKINEYILYPGDEFSYNEVVGVRTEEAGFLPAPAYVDGDVKDEIGGGACQVSSTLYAATAFAFLETVERECHYFPVNYMQMGTDATVTIPEGGGRSIDFKFKNNKNYPVKLVGIFDNENSTLTFEVWGTLEENDYMPVGFDNSYTWQYDYQRIVEPAYEDREGYVIKFKTEIYGFEDDVGSGYRTLTHRLVLDLQGNVVLDEIINKKLENGNYAMDTYYQH
ncbi:MAG: VanW family protein [Oscillospiraceae bacterium]|nr:VanW family protein [Oscillospiraceae bacterium]